MRLDRAFTLAVVSPGRRLAGRQSSCGLPILMYHRLCDEPETDVRGYYRVNTSKARFQEQLSFLSGAGYRTVGLGDAMALLRGGGIPDKKVVITFDDGFQDFYTEAFPVLSAHGFSATMFLPTGFIADTRRSFKGTECLTWNEVREMNQAGIQFGSHTVNHPELVRLPWKQIEDEVSDSKKELESRLGEAVTSFAYPFAFPQGRPDFARRFRMLLQATGYNCCVTTEVGCARPGDDAFRLKRLPVNSLDDPAFFQAKLRGAYDWLAVPQALVKALKARLN